MNWLRTLTVLALVALWLPATNHCRLEQIPGLNFLSCCEHEESVPHQDNDCETDSCAAVEEGLYKTEDCQVTVFVPVFAAPPLLSMAADIPRPDTVTTALSCATTTLVPPASWQFLSRAALPPRAPSIVS